ncbi:MAG: SURF1 family protein [Rhodobacteraceae bacterium]|nr:SURF1 family protein [Paracoccaceae bacterium]
MKRVLFAVFSIAGTAVLGWLGNWQLDRLAWKQTVLEQIDQRIAAPAVPVPLTPVPSEDTYLPVFAEGRFGQEYIRVLVSQKRIGAGYRVISAFKTEGRRILVDRGFIDLSKSSDMQADQAVVVQGNLHWPDEVDGFTPAPDLEKNIWFARDVRALSEALQTQPILIVASQISPPDQNIKPLEIDSSAIPNDPLQYAVTWFSLAAIWIMMSGAFLWRSRKKKKG